MRTIEIPIIRVTTLEGEIELQGLLTASETAKYLQVSRFTLNKIVAEGDLLPFRTPGGHRRFSLEMLDEYLQGTRQFPTSGEAPLAETPSLLPEEGR